jgi:hypothetical protein
VRLPNAPRLAAFPQKKAGDKDQESTRSHSQFSPKPEQGNKIRGALTNRGTKPKIMRFTKQATRREPVYQQETSNRTKNLSALRCGPSATGTVVVVVVMR